MIYHIYFNGLWPYIYDNYGNVNNKYTNNLIEPKSLLAKFIKESENNSFVFVVTTAQKPAFEQYLADYGLNNLIQFKMEQPITNPNYIERGRRLWLTVLQSPAHFVNDLYEEAEDMFLESEESNEH